MSHFQNRFLSLDRYLVLLLVLILLYIWIFTGLAFDQHVGMRTHRKDLGNIDTAIWNSSRGDFLQAVKGDEMSIRLTDHVEPIFVLISPIFWIWNDVRALLLLQVAVVAVGALPLYVLALEKLNQLLSTQARRQVWQREPLAQLTRPLALAVAVAYLLAPQLQSAVLTEFHAIPLAVPLILWAFWAVEQGRWGQFALAALLVTGVKEEAALLGAGLGAWALWRVAIRHWVLDLGYWVLGRHRARPAPSPANTKAILLATLVTLLSLVWFYLATFVIVPAYAVRVYDVAESGYFQRYGALGDSPLDIFKSFFTQPGLVWRIVVEPARVDYLWHLLAIFGFTSLLAPEILLLSLPVLLANVLSAYPAQYYGEFHYTAPLVPYFATAAAYGTARLWRFLARRFNRRSGSFQHMPASNTSVMALVSLFTNARTAVRPLIAAALLLWIVLPASIVYAERGRGPLGGRYNPTPIASHHRLLDRFTAQIPGDAAVSATAAVHPHVSHRRYVYQFPLGIEPPGRADWALLDVTTNTDMAPGDLKATVEAMLADDWGVADAADGFLLLRKGLTEKTIPDAFYDFARGSEETYNSQFATRHSISLGPLTFLGLDLEDWPLWRQTKATTLWRVEEGFQPGSVRPWLELRAPGGELLHTYAEIAPPALVWYPPERWQPGEVIRIETLWLFLPRHWGVAVGVVHGPDPMMPADRLPVATTNQDRILQDETATLALVAAFTRRGNHRLAPVPVAPEALPEAIHRVTQGRIDDVGGVFGDRLSLNMTAWLSGASIPAGQPLNLWLQWKAERAELLQTYMPFVHLRSGGEMVAQSDGRPRYFVPLAPGTELLPDWRQLDVPPDLPPGEYNLFAGLFDPSSGERLSAFDAGGHPVGTEILLGTVAIQPPLVPDQACALIPPACASQAE